MAVAFEARRLPRDVVGHEHGHLAVHPYRDARDLVVELRDPHLTERKAEVRQRESLQRGHAGDVIVGVNGPPRPRIIGERVTEHGRAPIEVDGFGATREHVAV
jgi:hypothetical protein